MEEVVVVTDEKTEVKNGLDVTTFINLIPKQSIALQTNTEVINKQKQSNPPVQKR